MLMLIGELIHFDTERGRRRMPRTAGALAVALALLLCVGSPPLAAQTTATFAGRVLDAVSGRPLTAATVTVVTTGQATRTDSLGRFEVRGLAVGIHRFLVSAPGHARGSLSLAFAARERMERDLELEPTEVARAAVLADSASRSVADTARVQALPGVGVTADASAGRRYADFERRRATGRGQYRTRAELEAGQYYTLQDAMRGMRGLRFNCAGGTCRAQMVRAPMGCAPEYVVDERVDNAFGPTIPIRDIVGLEVYTGVSDVPGEFAGQNSGCGVIVIWTTSGREPRRK